MFGCKSKRSHTCQRTSHVAETLPQNLFIPQDHQLELPHHLARSVSRQAVGEIRWLIPSDTVIEVTDDPIIALASSNTPPSDMPDANFTDLRLTTPKRPELPPKHNPFNQR
jgi:hypothetical protein